MHIKEIFAKHKVALSFEFLPPKSPEAMEDLNNTIAQLGPLAPAYVSVTYGAGGSTRQLTHDIVVKIQNETGIPVVSHLTCVGAAREEIGQILRRYHDSGIRNIMALRGDPPKGQANWVAAEGGFLHACELVSYIRANFPDMGIGVAGFPEGHPATPNRLTEMDYFKAKVDAGADYICTQLFFDNRDFYDFCERCEIAGIRVPIVAGIMPITSMKTLLRMADLAAGSRFPARLLKSLHRAQSDAEVARAGIHWAAEQVRDLLDNGVKGIHFYTLNKANPIRTLCDSIGISHSSQFDKTV